MAPPGTGLVAWTGFVAVVPVVEAVVVLVRPGHLHPGCTPRQFAPVVVDRALGVGDTLQCMFVCLKFWLEILTHLVGEGEDAGVTIPTSGGAAVHGGGHAGVVRSLDPSLGVQQVAKLVQAL